MVYSVSEAAEVAEAMAAEAPPRFKNMDEARRWVKPRMQGESVQVIDNAAEALLLRQQEACCAASLPITGEA